MDGDEHGNATPALPGASEAAAAETSAELLSALKKFNNTDQGVIQAGESRNEASITTALIFEADADRHRRRPRNPGHRDTEHRRACRICHDLLPDEVGLDGANWTQLQDSAAAGCANCSLVSDAVLYYMDDAPHVKMEVSVNTTQFAPCVSVRSFEQRKFFSFELIALANTTPALKERLPRSFPRDTSEPASIRRALKSIRDCHAKHSCPRNPDAALPDRILDVRAGKVRLHISHGEHDRYTTLSHRWSAHADFTTTSTNLSARLHSIEWDAMPQMYRDAITFTRKLHISYIWIDSLCILQDSASDWQIQSAKMGSIYEHSYLTLAADLSPADSSSLADGCFSGPAPPFDELHLQYNGEDASIRLNLLTTFSPGTYKFAHVGSALSRRGWVYQEQLLSPRYLWFRSSELIFACCKGEHCHCTAHYIPSPTSVLRSYLLRVTSQSRSSTREERYRLWRNLIVPRYTDLALTFAKDRLPALSGLTKRFGLDVKNDYIAGLWRGDGIKGLMWQRHSQTHPDVRSMQSELTAPSWSWASLTTTCVYDFSRTHRPDAERSAHPAAAAAPDTILTSALRPDPATSIHASILSATIALSSPDPAGCVLAGSISLRGPIRAGTLRLLPSISWRVRGLRRQHEYWKRRGREYDMKTLYLCVEASGGREAQIVEVEQRVDRACARDEVKGLGDDGRVEVWLLLCAELSGGGEGEEDGRLDGEDEQKSNPWMALMLISADQGQGKSIRYQRIGMLKSVDLISHLGSCQGSCRGCGNTKLESFWADAQEGTVEIV